MSSNYHHGNLRTALIEAGIALISSEGTSGLSLRKAASLCNVSHAAPYAHFKSKEELFAAMQSYVAKRFEDIFIDILARNDTGNPDIINKLGIAYVEFFIDNPKYFNFLFANGNMKINLEIDNTAKSFAPFQIFKDTAINIYTNLGLNEQEVENIIIMKWATVHGLAAVATMNGITYKKDWKSQLNTLLCLPDNNLGE